MSEPEYKILNIHQEMIDIPYEKGGSSTYEAETLAKLGREGWELVSVISGKVCPTYHHDRFGDIEYTYGNKYYFRRK